jgi:hypothetical protein
MNLLARAANALATEQMNDETLMAWGKLALGWPRPAPDPKEIARLLRLGEPVPEFAQRWLAELFSGEGALQLVLKTNGRAAQKYETEQANLRKALEIASAMNRGKTIVEAIREIMPVDERQAYRALEALQRSGVELSTLRAFQACLDVLSAAEDPSAAAREMLRILECSN